jgi:hypothetical protein
MTASLKRRLKALEASKRSAGKRCVFCEQWYWTLVAPRTAIGPYSETEWGNEAGLAVARAPRDAHFEVRHAGVEAAMRDVEQTRPRNPRCERCGE